MNAMQPPQSIEEIKAGLETTEKGGVRQSIRNCLTVFQRDPLLSGAIAYNILTDRKDIMEIRGDRLTDKENAGAALLDTCKEVKGKDPVQIGSYRGFTMSVAFDSMWKTYTLTLKGQMTHRVELGSDARGNLVRIENALDKMPERLRSVQEQLENLYNQQAAAKAEVGKPFPQEQELAAKTARLIELDMELNLDGKGQPQPEQAIAKSTRPSVLDRLKAPPVHGAPEKPHKKEMEAR